VCGWVQFDHAIGKLVSSLSPFAVCFKQVQHIEESYLSPAGCPLGSARAKDKRLLVIVLAAAQYAASCSLSVL